MMTMAVEPQLDKDGLDEVSDELAEKVCGNDRNDTAP